MRTSPADHVSSKIMWPNSCRIVVLAMFDGTPMNRPNRPAPTRTYAIPGPLWLSGLHTTMSYPDRLRLLYWLLVDPGWLLSDIRTRPIRTWPSVTCHRLSFAIESLSEKSCNSLSWTFSAKATFSVSTTGGLLPFFAKDSGPPGETDVGGSPMSPSLPRLHDDVSASAPSRRTARARLMAPGGSRRRSSLRGSPPSLSPARRRGDPWRGPRPDPAAGLPSGRNRRPQGSGGTSSRRIRSRATPPWARDRPRRLGGGGRGSSRSRVTAARVSRERNPLPAPESSLAAKSVHRSAPRRTFRFGSTPRSLRPVPP